MTDKPFHEMSDDELKTEFIKWSVEVEKATGWGAALAQAAKWRNSCKEILKEHGIVVKP